MLGSVMVAQTPADEAASVDAVLSNEPLLQGILSFLPVVDLLRAAVVCKAFREAVGAAPQWTHIKGADVADATPAGNTYTYEEGSIIGNRLARLIQRYGNRCVTLDLSNSLWLHSVGLETLMYAPNLHVLDLSNCERCTFPVFETAVQHLPNLKVLRTRGCQLLAEPAMLQSLWDLPATKTLNLRELDVKDLAFLQDRYQLDHLPQLLQRLTRGNQLQTLVLGCSEDHELGFYAGNLERVFDVVLRNAAMLERLEATGILHLGGQSELMPSGPQQQEQQQSRVFHDTLAALAVLRVLNLRGSLFRSGTLDASAGLSACPTTRLTSLNLRAVSWVTDACLEPLLARNGHCLAELNVSCAKALTDATLHAVARHCSAALRLLDVCYAPKMTAQGVMFAAGRLPRLTHLGCSGLADLSDADVVQLAAQHPDLRMIGFGGIGSLTDASLAALGQHCTRLTSLYAADSPKITMQGMSHLLSRCPALRRVCVRDCANISPADQRSLQERYPYAYDPDAGLDAEIFS